MEEVFSSRDDLIRNKKEANAKNAKSGKRQRVFIMLMLIRKRTGRW